MNDLCPTEKDRLDAYLDSVEHLPATPLLMIKLIEMFRQPDHDLDEIVGLMRQDPSLMAEILGRCNKSFLANEEPVMDVNEAIFRLGFYEVYQIAVALFGLQAMSMAKVTKSINVETLWHHSAMTAIAGGAIAREVGEPEGIIFTAGLLHDVGRIVLASAEGSRYSELVLIHGHSGAALNEGEKAAFGVDHAEVGARLLARWGLPDQVSVPVLCHHRASWSEPFERVAAVVKLANLVAHWIEENDLDNPAELPEADHAMALLGLKHENLPALLQLVRGDMKNLNSFCP